MEGTQGARQVDAVVRALSTAGKSLRLYPASSPIPRQAVDAAAAAIGQFFTTGEPVLSLVVARDGFMAAGVPVAVGAVGAGDLVNELRDHGVAELDILPGCTATELLAFLDVVGRETQAVRGDGGVSAVLAGEGIESIRVTDVHLTVVEHVGPAADQDVDEFLRELGRDPDRLSAWFAAASAGDPRAFEEGLMELVRVSGPRDFETLLKSLSSAFTMQSAEGKDALIGLAIDSGPTRDLAGGMFRFMQSSDITGAVMGGVFGKNMLSLSTALTRLPLEQVTAQVRSEIQGMLPGTGHSDKEARFLEHMIETRESKAPERPLADTDQTYRSVIAASAVPRAAIDAARQAVTSSGSRVTIASVHTMSMLLDQQKDFELFCQGADGLAGMVPRLIEQGELELAAKVLADLSNRASYSTGPWPELSSRLQQALAHAASPQAMGALLRAFSANRALGGAARNILRHGGDAAANALVHEALALKAPGMEAAEELLGRRVVEVLNHIAPQAQWFQLRVIVDRLAREGDSRSTATIAALMRRPDEQSRREVANGLADAATPATVKFLGQGLKDPSVEIAIVAARGLGRVDQNGTAALLAARFSELDTDNSDFLLGRQIIDALAKTKDPGADAALAKLASRRALIKRGHFAEIQDLVGQAMKIRSKGGAGR